MARLTPIDYQMQVMNPMAAALKGYQAGFGQMQQLDEVRRQREADAMNRELQEMQMAQLRSKQAEAQAAQRLQADFYTGLSDGTMTIAGAREFLANPLISESLASTINAYVSDESDDQIRGRMQDTAYLTMLERSDPDLFNAEMDRRVEAAFNANNQEQVDFLRNIRQLSDLDPSAAQSLGMQMVSGLASKLGDEGKLFQEAFLEGLKLGEPEAPLSTIGKLSADLEAGRITQKQFDAEVASRQRRDQQMGFHTVTRPDGTTEVIYGPLGEVDIGETGRVRPGYQQVQVLLSDGTVEPVQRVIAGSEQEDAIINDLVRANRMVSDIDTALNHPGMPYRFGATGFATQPGGLLPAPPGTDLPEAEGILQQIQGSTFLQAFEQLKGGGQITEPEGRKATQSLSRLDQRGMKWEAAQRALNELRDVAINAQLRARAKLPPSTYEKFFGEDADQQEEGRGAGISRDEDLLAKYGV